jgi:dTDP-4-dehydrorhamnose reductase
MKIWVTGADGMLGSALVQSCLNKRIDITGTSRQEANILQFDALSSMAAHIRPTHMVNCAAYTDVDGAEREPQLAISVNTEGAGNIARVARGCAAHLIHISTDYVFNGNGTQPYVEEDLCAPSNQYGRSKWEGEKRVLEILPDACILRTSWLFGTKGKNFISSLMSWFQQKEELQVVFDQRGKPTYCYDLAEAVLTLLNASGIVHFANEGERSRYQIALDLMEASKEREIPLRCQRIIPVPSSQFPTPAVRPAYSVLNTNKYFHLTNIKPRPWGEILNDYLSHYASST